MSFEKMITLRQSGSRFGTTYRVSRCPNIDVAINIAQVHTKTCAYFCRIAFIRRPSADKLRWQKHTKILEYVEEKAAGLYGGSRSQRRQFAARLSIEKLPVCGETESTLVPEHNGITGVNGERPWVIPEVSFGSRS